MDFVNRVTAPLRVPPAPETAAKAGTLMLVVPSLIELGMVKFDAPTEMTVSLGAQRAFHCSRSQLTSSSVCIGHAFSIIRCGCRIGYIIVVSHAYAVHVQAVVSLDSQLLCNTGHQSIFQVGKPVVEIGGEIGDDSIENAAQI